MEEGPQDRAASLADFKVGKSVDQYVFGKGITMVNDLSRLFLLLMSLHRLGFEVCLAISELGHRKFAEFFTSAHFKKKETTKSSDSLSSVDKLQADFKTHVVVSASIARSFPLGSIKHHSWPLGLGIALL